MNKVKSRFQSLDSQLNLEELEQPIMKLKKRTRSLLPITAKPRVIRFFLLTSLTLFVSFAHVKAEGFGSLRVTVTNQNDTPIVQANLCFVLSTQTIGGKQTDSSGGFNASLPPGTVTVHVSKQGFLNSQQAFNITNGGNLVHQFHLSPGTSTPLPPGCGIPGTTIPGSGGFIRITDFNVVGGTTTTNPRVTLRATFDTYPRAYRIREFTAAEQYPGSWFTPERAFQRYNVPWQPMPPGHLARDGNTLELEFNLNPDAFGPGYGEFGTHTIYLQVAKVAFYDPSTSAGVDAAGGISNTKGVSVVLAPAQLKTYTLTGVALDSFVQQSRQRGYRFDSSSDVVTYDVDNTHCPPGSRSDFMPPLNRDRNSNSAAVYVAREGFEVFIGPDLNPFWKAKSIHFLPLPTIYAVGNFGGRPAKVITTDGPGRVGGPSSIRHVFSSRLAVYPYSPPLGSHEVARPRCIVAPLPTPDISIRELVLEGPSGKNPIDALPRLP